MANNLICAAGRVGRRRRDRLVHLRDGQPFGPVVLGGTKTSPNPTDRGKNGSKRHLIVEAGRIPLAVEHTGANVHDSEMVIALVDGIPPIYWPQGRPRRRPDEVLADRAHDAEERIQQPLRNRGITPRIVKRHAEHGSGLSRFRYVVEAAFDWLFNQRRLRVRYEKRDDIHSAFLIIGCFLICWRRIRRIMGFC
jgi:transposase